MTPERKKKRSRNAAPGTPWSIYCVFRNEARRRLISGRVHLFAALIVASTRALRERKRNDVIALPYQVAPAPHVFASSVITG